MTKRAPGCGCLGYRFGMKSYPVMWGLFHKTMKYGSLLNNQDSMESIWGFFRGSYDWRWEVFSCNRKIEDGNLSIPTGWWFQRFDIFTLEEMIQFGGCIFFKWVGSITNYPPEIEHRYPQMGVSKNSGTPKWMVKIMENPFENGWFGGKTHYFRKQPKKRQKLKPARVTDSFRPILGLGIFWGHSKTSSPENSVNLLAAGDDLLLRSWGPTET